ncbi:MAG TPA: SpoIIE family protein phosphatase, partial [Jatrophihabitantaceae bacterium]
LGTVPNVARDEVRLEVPPGGLLVLYTDGLVERRDTGIDTGLKRLRGAVRADHPETVAREVMKQLVGAEIPTDDIALIAVRRSS